MAPATPPHPRARSEAETARPHAAWLIHATWLINVVGGSRGGSPSHATWLINAMGGSGGGSPSHATWLINAMGGSGGGAAPLPPRAKTMDILIQQVVSGLATGGIYASLALALVMIYQATDVVNFAQGSMAMFSTYLCWSLLQAGLPYWIAFFATIVIAFVGGLLIERTVIRPVENAPILTIVIVTLGLVFIFTSVAGWIYSYIQKPFPSPFPNKPIKLGQIVLGAHDVGAICVTLVVLVLLFLFFRYTTLGLAMRAAAQDPNSSRLCGIRVGWMLALGWGLAAVFGA